MFLGWSIDNSARSTSPGSCMMILNISRDLLSPICHENWTRLTLVIVSIRMKKRKNCYSNCSNSTAKKKEDILKDVPLEVSKTQKNVSVWHCWCITVSHAGSWKRWMCSRVAFQTCFQIQKPFEAHSSNTGKVTFWRGFNEFHQSTSRFRFADWRRSSIQTSWTSFPGIDKKKKQFQTWNAVCSEFLGEISSVALRCRVQRCWNGIVCKKSSRDMSGCGHINSKCLTPRHQVSHYPMPFCWV